MPELGFAGRVTLSMLSTHGGLLIAGAAPTAEPPGRRGRRKGATGRTRLFAGDVRLVFDDSGAVVAFSSTGTMDRWTPIHDRVTA